MKKLILNILFVLCSLFSFAQQQFDVQGHSTTGSDTYTVSITNLTSYEVGSSPVRGVGFSIIFDTSSSGACTLNVNGLGAITINGDITAGVVYRLEYNVVTDEFDIISGGGSSADIQSVLDAGGTASVTNDVDILTSGYIRLESSGEAGLYRTGNSLRVNTDGSVSLFTGTVGSTDNFRVDADGDINLPSGPGSSGQVLTSAGAGSSPTWETPSASGTTMNKLPVEYRVANFDIQPSDTSKLLVLDDGVDINADDLATAVDGSQFVAWSPSVSNPPAITSSAVVVLDTGSYTYMHFNNDTLRVAAGSSGGGGGGTGDVVGPASSTDGAPALFDGTTGKLLKNSTPTGTGNPVLATSPTLVTPALGTPSALTLTNATGLPISGITGLGTNVGTWLATPSWTNFNAAITGTAPFWATSGGTTVTTPTITGKPTWSQASESSTNTFQTFTQAAHTGGSPVGLLFTGGAHTGLAASTEAIDVNINTTRTVNFTNGAKTTQRSVVVGQPTYTATGSTTITTAASFAVVGAPVAGSNVTITNSYSGYFGGPLFATGTGTSTGYGLRVYNNLATNPMLSVRDDSYIQIGRTDFPSGMFRTNNGTTPAQTNVNLTIAGSASGSTSAVPVIGFYTGDFAESSGTNTRIARGSTSSMVTFTSTTGATPTFYYDRAAPTVNVTTSTSPYYTYSAAPVYTAEATRGGGFIYEPTTPSNMTGRDVAYESTSGQIVFDGEVSPAQITANTDDYAPTGHLRTLTLRLSTDASRNLTSVQGGVDGRLLVIFNIGAQNLVIKDDDGATGTAANRFQLNADITILPEQGRMFMYDGTSSRWRAISNQ